MNSQTTPQTEPLRITAKVQLHIHLNASIRHESVLPIAEKFGVTLPVKTTEELREKTIMTKPESLTTFLARFVNWMPALVGNSDGIRRMAREFAEDMNSDNVIYTEARLCPHLMANENLSADEVLECVLEEFSAAEKLYDIKLRVILSCIRNLPEHSLDILQQCVKYKDRGVVAIDLAGDENLLESGQMPTQQEHIQAFQEAKRRGIHRTAHAGENGSSKLVVAAIDTLLAERVGHGYRTLQDEALYQKLLKERFHFECCPYSSYITGACTPVWKDHSIKRFAEDNFNFGINSDDTTVTGTNLSKEFEIAENKIGVSKPQLIRTIFHAARAAFLPDSEKKELLEKLHSIYDPMLPEAIDF